MEHLYQLGASRVFVPNDRIRDYEKLKREIGGASSDAIVVVLPREMASQRALLEFYRRETSTEGLEDEMPDELVVDGQYLYFWWD